ncbi:hydrolase [Corallococcus praedator]|uniref:Hydrolase n=1 Tax=Corallococcus praedator TaxID=2316724 RepID=A0ABX9Q8W3_9BACT|nr:MULTISPECIES: hydrolase [Corallococcus]RKH00863.1 hydrolase [Corallococcus sp. CA047B]RKH19864.1 hydrolase [Corallococcus sp. CA031C]RKH92465.1 hydrolase [Corallococcus praedator]
MKFQPTEPFIPAPGLRGAHAQTIFASLARPTRSPPLRRERRELPDGDFVDLDSFDGPTGAPHVVVLHGLEGSSQAGYVTEVLRGAAKRGWGATAINFRSCSGEPNRLARAYHSGDTNDTLLVMEDVRARITGPMLAVGFSLGANVLCRLLEETGDSAPVVAAASISAPYDLDACCRKLDSGDSFLWFYRQRFLRTLKSKSRAKLQRFPGAFDLKRMQAAYTLRAFDDVVTGPMHGFQDAAHYYREASSGPHLGDIRRPTLLLSAADDPMLESPVVPLSAPDNPFIHVVLTEYGGHVGFVAGSLLRPSFWAENQALVFFEQVLAKRLAAT